jgi:cell division protein FtsW (lipid II flippase)
MTLQRFFQTLRRVMASGEGRRSPDVGHVLRSRLSLSRSILAVAMLVALVFVLDWWRVAFRDLVDSEHVVRQMQELTIALVPGEPVQIGRDELGQGSAPDAAAVKHLELLLKDDRAGGAIYIGNISSNKRLELHYRSSLSTFAERFEIFRPGVRFDIGKTTLSFTHVTADSFELDVAQPGRADQSVRRFRYDHGIWRDTLLTLDGAAPHALVDCQELGFLDWLGRVIAIRIPGLDTRDISAAFLGGALDCIDDGGRRQIGLPGTVGWHGLQIIDRGGRFFLSVGPDISRARFPIRMAGAGEGAVEAVDGFDGLRWRIDEPVDGPRGLLAEFVAGRTRYSLQASGWAERNIDGRLLRVRTITIRPERNVAVYAAADCASDQQQRACPQPIAALDRDNCATAATIRQCWSDDFRPLDRAGTAAVMRRLPSGGVGIGENISATEWLIRIMFLGMAVAMTVWLLGVPLRRLSRIEPIHAIPIVRLRSLRYGVLLLSVVFALVPEITLLAFNHPLDAGGAMNVLIVNWALAGIVLIASSSGVMLGLLWIALTVLAAMGALTLASMAVDGPSTLWATYFIKHKYLFLDIVPPFVIAASVAPRERLAPIIQELIVSRRPIYLLLRVGPAILLALCFLMWLLFGTQTGLGAFQPVEAGKFAAVIICASALMSLDRSVRLQDIGAGVWRPFAFGVLTIFTLVLFVVPVMRKDFSPALIVGLLLLSVGMVHSGFYGVRIVAAAWERKVARARVPYAFRPKTRRGVIGPFGGVHFVLAGLLIAVLAIGNLGVLREWGLRTLLRVGQWPSTPTAQMAELESALGTGRQIPVQRFLTWIDLDFNRHLTDPDRQKDGSASISPTARYRDIEFQEIRSRVAVAHADCAISSPFGAGRSLRAQMTDAIANRIAPVVDRFVNWRSEVAPLCPAFASEDTMDLLEPGPPINIPVVQFDFTAAYLFARLGAGAAFAVYLAQAFFAIVVLCGVLQIHANRGKNPLEASVHQFLAVAVMGALTLYVLQWAMAWSNILGLLPVMGQPMTWLSAGTSHHLFMALPCLILIVIGLRFGRRGPRVLPARTPPRQRSTFFRW